MKKNMLLFIAFLFIIVLGYKISLIIYKGAYKVGGTKGYSNSIIESKERGVFVEELDFVIVPDSLGVIDGKKFYIEKSWRYGEYDSKVTDTIKYKDDYKFQIRIDPPTGYNIVGPYRIGKGGGWLFNVPKNVYTSDIITETPFFDSIYKVGELKLFVKKKDEN